MNFRTLLLCVILFTTTLLLYLITLHPFFPVGDSGEFIVAAKIFGVSHPAGAAVYSIFSYIFALIPIGSLIERINFLSALFGALSIPLLFLLVYKITRNIIPSFAASVFLAISGQFWSFSTIAVVYPMAIFFMLLLLNIFNAWLENKHNFKYFYAIFIISGLAVNVHYFTIGLIALILLITILLFIKNFFSYKKLLGIFISLFFSLSPILIIPIAASHNPFLNWDNPSNLANFWRFITGADYGLTKNALGKNGLDFVFSLSIYFQYLISSFGIVGIAIALLSFLRKKISAIEGIIILAFIFFVIIFIAYSNSHFFNNSDLTEVLLSNKRQMQHGSIFSFPFIAILIGLGLNNLWVRLKKIEYLGYLAAGFLILVLFYNFILNYSLVENGRNKIFQYYGQNIIQSIKRPTILITGLENSNVLNYFYTVEPKYTKNIYLISFSFLQIPSYVDSLRKRYPEIYIPFKSITLGKQLDDFYKTNLKKFDIVFAPLDDQMPKSISNNFLLLPYGLTMKLVSASTNIDRKQYVLDNYSLDKNFIGKKEIFDKTYTDIATNEIKADSAIGYVSIGLTMNRFGFSNDALFFLRQAEKIQPMYINSFVSAAKILRDEKNYDMAVTEYLKILAVSPNNPDAFRGLAITYYLSGDNIIALKYAQDYALNATTVDSKNEAQGLLQALQNGRQIIIH
jgi:4-amino-4-deoxy-L-arabinose transferase-like glycosyltransferase